jgi:virginiamycin A acetyltransferase
VVLRRGFYWMTLAQFARNATVEWGTWFSHSSTRMGARSYIGTRSIVGICEIGDDAMIGSNVDILSGGRQHTSAGLDVPRNIQRCDFGRVCIGRNAWIGNSVVILADVGDDSVVGAGSVVAKPIPPRCMAAGNPATIKKRLAESKDERLCPE